MRMQRNFYEVLGLPRTATKKEIKEKYYSLARQFHPDRAADKQLADRLFVQINRAYSTLFNDIKRAKYDASLDALDQAPARSVKQSGADQPASPQQVRNWFDQASRLQIGGDTAQAMTVCTKVVEAEPNFLPGLILMGDLLMQSGNLQKASETFAKASSLQPANLLLRDKIARLNILLEQQAAKAARPTVSPAQPAQRPANGAQRPTNGAQRPAASAQPPGYTQRPPVDNRPPVSQRPAATPPPTQRAPVTPAQPAPKPQAQPKSIFDKLLNRK